MLAWISLDSHWLLPGCICLTWFGVVYGTQPPTVTVYYLATISFLAREECLMVLIINACLYWSSAGNFIGPWIYCKLWHRPSVKTPVCICILDDPLFGFSTSGGAEETCGEEEWPQQLHSACFILRFLSSSIQSFWACMPVKNPAWLVFHSWTQREWWAEWELSCLKIFICSYLFQHLFRLYVH